MDAFSKLRWNEPCGKSASMLGISMEEHLSICKKRGDCAMGSGITWTCKDCGREIDLFYLGGSRANTESVYAECERGAFGEIAKYLVSDECPIEINVGMDACIYYCPHCNELIERWKLGIWASDDFYYEVDEAFPECPKCGSRHVQGPYSGDRALEVINEHEPTICPECGREASLRRGEYLA